MARPHFRSLIWRLVSAHARDVPDQHLLERFLAHNDEAAFATLIERHGAMVLRVAWNVLHHRQDAEDVLQATFLVLARQAGSVRKRGSVGSWLHGVAYRVALKARAAAAARRHYEASVPAPAPSGPPDDLTWRELSAILHEELERLPNKYRAPLVLCYLEGMTQEQAAEHLGLAKGTLKGRLERARLLLRGRLVRLGLAPGVVLLPDVYRPSGAALPVPVVSNTVRAAAAFAVGRSAGVSAQVAQMTEGVLKAMFVTKLQTAAALLLAISLVVGGIGVLASRGQPLKEGPPAQGGERPEKPEGDRGKEQPWGEAVGGWRMRLSLPSGDEYRRNTPLPLLLEVQNVSKRPLSLESLGWWNPDPEVSKDGKRLVARQLIDISPWEGKREELPARASLKWTVDFNRLRFSNQPLKAGTVLHVRFRQALPSEAPKGAPEAAQPRSLFSNEVTLKLQEDHPSVMAGEADLPPKWTDTTELVYREHVPLLGFRGLRIDGAGRVWQVAVSRGKGYTGPARLTRTEAVLDRDRLERLAKFLRDQKVWELADLAPDAIAHPDGGEIRLSLGAGRGSLVRIFPDDLARGEAKLRELKAVMEEVMAVAEKEAAAKEARDKGAPTVPAQRKAGDAKLDAAGQGRPSPAAKAEELVWGEPRNGLRLGVCPTKPKDDGKLRLWIVLDNVSTNDLVVNLGLMLANGKKQLPMAVRLIVIDGDGKEHILRRNEPGGIAGRVDPFVVPLSSGNRYAISCELEEWSERLEPGLYRVRAEFVGAAVTKNKVNLDTTGLVLMTYWTGTISSDELTITIPAKTPK